MGIGTRGGYYDGAGALRDMVQNHLMQKNKWKCVEGRMKMQARHYLMAGM